MAPSSIQQAVQGHREEYEESGPVEQLSATLLRWRWHPDQGCIFTQDARLPKAMRHEIQPLPHGWVGVESIELALPHTLQTRIAPRNRLLHLLYLCTWRWRLVEPTKRATLCRN